MAAPKHGQVTAATDTNTSGGWEDVVNARMTVGTTTDFDAGTQYLLLIRAEVGVSDVSTNVGLRVQHATTTFPGSEMQIRPRGTYADGNVYPYFWIGVWTATGTEDVDLQSYCSDVAQTGTIANTTMFFMSVDDLPAGSFYSNDDATVDTLSNGVWNTNTADVTFTPTLNDDWLVMGLARIECGAGNNNASYLTRINSSSPISETVPSMRQECEYVGEFQVHFVARYFANLAASSHTFTVESQMAGTGGTNEKEHQTIVAIRMNAFEQFAASYVAGPTALTTTTGYGTRITSASITPDTTENVAVIAYWSAASAEAPTALTLPKSRVEVDDVATPSTQADANKPPAWDPDDALGVNHFALFAGTASTSYTVSIDADESAATNEINADDATLVAFSLELAPTGGAAGMTNTIHRSRGGGMKPPHIHY